METNKLVSIIRKSNTRKKVNKNCENFSQENKGYWNTKERNENASEKPNKRNKFYITIGSLE